MTSPARQLQTHPHQPSKWWRAHAARARRATPCCPAARNLVVTAWDTSHAWCPVHALRLSTHHEHRCDRCGSDATTVAPVIAPIGPRLVMTAGLCRQCRTREGLRT